MREKDKILNEAYSLIEIFLFKVTKQLATLRVLHSPHHKERLCYVLSTKDADLCMINSQAVWPSTDIL